MNDYLGLLPETLKRIATNLDSVSPIPWPLWIGILFPIYIAAVSVVVWFLRGSVWPVHCAYPRTKRGGPCRNWVAGEWSRCRYHNRRRTYRYGHEVVTIQRWQTFARRGQIVDRPERGVGVVRFRPAGATLLYEKGYSRPPAGVLRLLPDKVRAVALRIRDARLWSRRPPNDPQDDPSRRSSAATRTDLAEGLDRVVRATQFATGAFGVAIVITLIAVALSGNVATYAQYVATLGFVLAWAATSSGIYERNPNWFTVTCRKAVRWWALFFVPVALVNLFYFINPSRPGELPAIMTN
ncbi:MULTISPECIES: hypothetical protein [unclassified Nocardia]|uniref:hypothetical protein n=1 Tax=unclassified Nocardia TaxID=2637762 RepID=UPI0024A83B2F|nr:MULTISPECIES: hypothetical protein [unclassified Nocardia]